MISKPPPVPPAEEETARQRLQQTLSQRPMTVRELSQACHLSEADVLLHLDHLRRSLERTGVRLTIEPPQCRACGFVFRKRSRLSKPARCPVCRHEQIKEPRFALR